MSKLAIIGLGYVGLPVASTFCESGREIVGYDIDLARIAEIQNGVDKTSQVDAVKMGKLSSVVTNDADELQGCREWIIIVQTGLKPDATPDISAVLNAAHTIAPMIKSGDLVVLSSTVPIGFTESEFLPILEGRSGLVAGQDFDLAYAPERFDPGNTVNSLATITKIISGFNAQALTRASELYRPVVQGMIEASSIKAAEASRLLENSQRDINIAFLNDAARILKGWNLDTSDVLEIAQTKWNWLSFRPGLAGGHCIPVHTHYLREAAVKAGVSPAVTGLVRETNEAMPGRIADACMEGLARRGLQGQPMITVLGISYKENVSDVRGSAAVVLVRALISRGCKVQIVDPLVRDADLAVVHGLSLVRPDAQRQGDAVIVAVAHRQFAESGWAAVMPLVLPRGGLIVDLQGILPRDAVPAGVDLWRL